MRTRPLRASALVLVAVAVAVAALAIAGASAASAPNLSPALPEAFRSWRHVRSIAVTDPGHGMHGFHDGYANEAALRGLRSKARPVRYEDGATFVVSIYEIVERDGIIGAGAKRRHVVQVKDRTATATGGWRFAAYDPGGRAIAVDASACFECHRDAQASDHVFTSYRE